VIALTEKGIEFERIDFDLGALAQVAPRPSLRGAVSADYPALLRDFLNRRNSWISRLQARAVA
jgi:hypothetical protein